MDPNASQEQKDKARLELYKDKPKSRRGSQSGSATSDDPEMETAGDDVHPSYKGQDAVNQVINTGRHQTDV